MHFTATPQQEATLKALNSGCATSMENGVETISVVDLTSGRVWHKATGGSLQMAFDNAMASLNKSAKPRSPAEIAVVTVVLEAENIKLREQLAALQSVTSKQPSKKMAPDNT